jgi:hypothetical protein
MIMNNEKIHSIISVIVPVYHPIILNVLVGMVTKASFNSPPKRPTSTSLAPLRNCISVWRRLGHLLTAVVGSNYVNFMIDQGVYISRYAFLQ